MPQMLIDLDIREGDILTVDGRDYPIKAIQTYKTDAFHGSTFKRVAIVRAAIYRRVSDGNGNYPKELLISNIPCTPLDPQTFENQRRDVLNTPEGILQCVIASGNGFYKLMLEDLKK